MLLETVFLALIEQVGLGAAEVDDLGTTIPVLLLHRALFAVVCVGNALTSADHTTTCKHCGETGADEPETKLYGTLVRAVVALIAYAHQGARLHVRVAHDARAIVLHA